MAWIPEVGMPSDAEYAERRYRDHLKTTSTEHKNSTNPTNSTKNLLKRYTVSPVNTTVGQSEAHASINPNTVEKTSALISKL